MIFQDRDEGGEILAEKLEHYRRRNDVVVLALPNGGVPVGFQVARQLRLPLDILVVRSLSLPGDQRVRFGALATGGEVFLDHDLIKNLGVAIGEINEIVSLETKEMLRHERECRGHNEPLRLEGLTIILIDEGLACGSAMRASISAVRKLGAKSVVVAVPVGSPRLCGELGSLVDDMICVHSPARFSAVSQWYQDFRQIPVESVKELLHLSQN